MTSWDGQPAREGASAQGPRGGPPFAPSGADLPEDLGEVVEFWRGREDELPLIDRLIAFCERQAYWARLARKTHDHETIEAVLRGLYEMKKPWSQRTDQ